MRIKHERTYSTGIKTFHKINILILRHCSFSTGKKIKIPGTGGYIHGPFYLAALCNNRTKTIFSEYITGKIFNAKVILWGIFFIVS